MYSPDGIKVYNNYTITMIQNAGTILKQTTLSFKKERRHETEILRET